MGNRLANSCKATNRIGKRRVPVRISQNRDLTYNSLINIV